MSPQHQLTKSPSSPKWGSYCTKCGNNFKGTPQKCPDCGIKSSLRAQELLPNAMILNIDTKDFLEDHCRTRFPDDVLAVVPSIIVGTQGAQAEIEDANERARKYAKAREARENRKPRKKPKTP